MYYEGHCGSCNYFLENDGKGLYQQTNRDYIKGFCTWYRSSYYPDDSCSHYEVRKDISSGGCYITTMICDKLGMDDNCESLETLRKFRNDTLQKDSKYASILYEYDSIGPMIAEKLKNEDISFVQRLYQSFIQPIVMLINNNEKDQAIEKYQLMTLSLKDCYGIFCTSNAPDDYNYQNGGHGKFLVKKYNS